MVNEVISRVHYIFGLRHRSLVGLRERLPSNSYSGEILSSSCEELRDFLIQPYRGMAQ